MARYDAAARRVAARVCSEVETEIEDRVFKMKVKKRDKALESGNKAAKIGRAIVKLRG